MSGRRQRRARTLSCCRWVSAPLVNTYPVGSWYQSLSLHRTAACNVLSLTLRVHLQELFATPYFCQEQTEEHFRIAQVGFLPCNTHRAHGADG